MKMYDEPMTCTNPAPKVTKPQLQALRRARDDGNPYRGCGKRTGGAYARMVRRLSDAGMLEKQAPWGITAFGRGVLAVYGL